jgi:arylsulfatase A-like enzyme
VLTQLYREGKLTPAQAILVAPQRPPEELYDLQNDPHELTNLADSPAHKAVLAEMRSKLETWIRETKDLGEIPEDPTIIEGVIDDWKKREETGRNGKKE